MNRRGLLKSFLGAAVLAVAPHFPRAAVPIVEGAGWESIVTGWDSALGDTGFSMLQVWCIEDNQWLKIPIALRTGCRFHGEEA